VHVVAKLGVTVGTLIIVPVRGKAESSASAILAFQHATRKRSLECG